MIFKVQNWSKLAVFGRQIAKNDSIKNLKKTSGDIVHRYVPTKFQKNSSSRKKDKNCRGQTDRQTDRQTDDGRKVMPIAYRPFGPVS